LADSRRSIGEFAKRHTTARRQQLPLLADSVEKVFFGRRTKFFRPLMRSTRGDSAEVVSELLAK
jgi:hypothetical protein